MSDPGDACVHLAAHRADDRLAQGGGRGHAPAGAGAARRGRAVGQGPHRHPRPVAAAHLAPPQAARRGRPDRPLPRGRLGLLPPDRDAARARRSAASSWRWPTRTIPVLAARPRPARGDQARAGRDGAPLLRRQRRRLGHDPRRSTSPRTGRGGDPRGRRRPAFRSPARSRHRHRAACSNCSRRTTAAASASTPRREMLAVARANLDRAGHRQCPGPPRRHLRPAARRATASTSSTIHQVLHYLDDPERALCRGGAGAAARRAAADRRLRAARRSSSCASEHAHRRLGFADDQMRQWIDARGLALDRRRSTCRRPARTSSTVTLWLAHDRRMLDRRQRDREVA